MVKLPIKVWFCSLETISVVKIVGMSAMCLEDIKSTMYKMVYFGAYKNFSSWTGPDCVMKQA